MVLSIAIRIQVHIRQAYKDTNNPAFRAVDKLYYIKNSIHVPHKSRKERNIKAPINTQKPLALFQVV